MKRNIIWRDYSAGQIRGTFVPLSKTNCPDCGRLVDSIFDHLVIDDCALLPDEEVAAAMEEAKGQIGS
jgi:hypothetical protein